MLSRPIKVALWMILCGNRTGEGAYHNPETGESIHDDRTHASGKDPHWTYTDPQVVCWDNFGDGWIEQ